MWVSTFHSACVRILRRDADKLGFPRQFTIYDQADAVRLTGYVIRDLGLDTKRFPPRSIHAAISAAKNDGLDAEAYAPGPATSSSARSPRSSPSTRPGSPGPARWTSTTCSARPCACCASTPTCWQHYQRRFKHILVDEYQDTNRVQNDLVLLLAADHRNVCVVGDQDQSHLRLPRRRHAQHRRVRGRVPRHDGGAARAELPVDADHPRRRQRGHRQQPRRKPKELWTDQGAGDQIVRYHADDEVDEAQWIAREITRLHDSHRGVTAPAPGPTTRSSGATSPSSTAPTPRAGCWKSSSCGPASPTRWSAAPGSTTGKEIKDAIAYLRAVVNPVDEVSLKRVSTSPSGAWATRPSASSTPGPPPTACRSSTPCAGPTTPASAARPLGASPLPAPARRRGRPGRGQPRPAAAGAARAVGLPRRARGRAHDRVRGPAGEPGRAGGRGQRVRDGRRVPRADQPGGRHRRARRRRHRRSCS